MGTSSIGPGPNVVPKPERLDDGAADGGSDPSPAPSDVGVGNGDDTGTNESAAPNNVSPSTSPLPIAPATQLAIPFSRARSDFTRFTKTGDKRALSRAISGYVKSSGGSKGGVRRMPNSVKTAFGFASLASSFARVGPVEALRRFNLQDLAGKPAAEVFERLVDELCHEGGTLDEAVARDALIDTIEAFAEQEVVNFDQLTPDLWKEFLADLIANCIVSKVINEIGTNSLHGSADDNLYREAETTLREYTSGAVRDELKSPLDPSISSEELEGVINEIFETSFAVLQAMLEEKP